MRNLVEVVDQVVQRVPRLAPSLAAVRESAKFAAPEMRQYFWDEFVSKLNQLRSTLSADEDRAVRAIVEGDDE